MKKNKLVIFALAAISATALSTAIACSTGDDGHKHSYSMKSNSTHHYEECGCGDKINYEAHYDILTNGTETDTPDGKCDACGFLMSDAVTKHTVTFNMKGVGTAPADQQVPEGSKATKPATDPEDENYDFVGWCSDEACTTLFDFNSEITAPTTVYAKWEEKTSAEDKVTVTFNMKGVGTAPEAQKVTKGSKAVKPADPKHDDYNFVCWCVNEACTAPFDFDTEISETTVLYAKWELKAPAEVTYTVNFDMKGVGVAPANQTVVAGSGATEPEAPSADNFTFVGWFSDTSCTTPFDFGAEINADTTVYAKWEAVVETGKVVVTFDMKGVGTAPEPQLLEEGENATKPQDPSVYNYTFGGWYADEACATAFDFETPVAEATTVYAKWTKIAGYFEDKPVTLAKGTAGSLTFKEGDNLYFKFTAGAKGRYTISLGTLSARSCKFTTDLDTVGVYYGNGCELSEKTLDLNRGASVVITLVRPNASFSANASVGVLVDDCEGEELPEEWTSGRFVNSNVSYDLTFDRDGTELKLNNISCQYKYWGGSYDAVLFDHYGGSNGQTKTSYKLKLSGAEELLLYKVTSFSEDLVATLKPFKTIDVSKFEGKYTTSSPLGSITEIVIYASGNGYMIEGGTKMRYLLGDAGNYYNTQNNTLCYGSYYIAVLLDEDGNTTGINIRRMSTESANSDYARVGDAGEELPYLLPLPSEIELKGTHLTLLCSQGTQRWGNYYGKDVEITGYDKAQNEYTVTYNYSSYLVTISGEGDQTIVKLYTLSTDEEGNEVRTLYDTLQKEVITYVLHDIVTDTEMNISSANFVKNIYYFKVKETGSYTFKTPDKWLYLYTGLSESELGELNGTMHQFSSAKPDADNLYSIGPFTLVEGDIIALSAAEYAGLTKVFTLKVDLKTAGGEPDGSSVAPFIAEVGNNGIADTKSGTKIYYKFTAETAGTYKFAYCYEPSWGGDNNYITHFTIDGTDYGFSGSDLVWVGGLSYADHYAKLELSAGQTVVIALDSVASPQLTLEIVKA